MAIRVRPSQPGWRAVILHDPAGDNIFHSAFAFGTPQPRAIDSKSFTRLVSTLRPTVIDYTDGPISGRPLEVRVPVLRDGRLQYIISATIDRGLDQILKQQRLAAGGTGSYTTATAPRSPAVRKTARVYEGINQGIDPKIAAEHRLGMARGPEPCGNRILRSFRKGADLRLLCRHCRTQK